MLLLATSKRALNFYPSSLQRFRVECMTCMPTALQSPLRFGAFEFNPASGELRKHGLVVKLTPLTRTLLSELLQSPTRILTRKELQSRLWPSRDFLDFEHGLNKVVHSLRTALGDEGRNSRFIETLPRRGYRFIPVWLQISGRRATDAPSVSGGFSVAVLPIEVVDGGHEEALFARLLASALTDTLSEIQGLSVLAQGTVRSFNINGMVPQFAGVAMGVNAVIAGEMIVRGSEIYLRMELFDVSDGRQILPASVTRTNMADHTAEEVANELLCKFRPALLSAENSKAARLN